MAVYGIHYFFNALAPEVSPDGSGYHLEIVSEYLRQKGLVAIPTNMYANMPGGLEMLFLLAFSVGRHSAAALVHFGFLLTLPLLLLCFGRRFGHPRAGVFAALLAFATPVIGIDGISAYNDVALATTAFAVFYLLQLWDESRERALLPLIGLLAGFCFALKYTGGFMTIYAVCFVAWRMFRTKQAWWRGAAIVAGVGAMLIAPWLIKNWIFAGNPLSPFYNSIFPNPYVTITFEREYRDVLSRFNDGESRWRGLLDAALSGRLSEGLLGPSFLLAPLALLSLRYQIGRRALLAAAIFLPGYLGNYGGRFLIPSVPFLGMALAFALEGSRGMLPTVLLFHLITCWYQVVPIYADPTAWRLRQTPHRAALRLVSEESYFVRKLPDWTSASMLESTLPPDAIALSAEPIPQAYTSRRVIVGFQSALGRTLQEILQTPIESLQQQPRREFRFRFPAQRLRAIRVRQTAPRDLAEWSISEFRVWLRARELPRTAAWRPTASSNPWEANLALDDSYVTRWNSREPLYPEMTFEVDFGTLEEVDMTTLEATDGQPIKLKLEGLDANGVWKPFAAEPELAVSRAPSGFAQSRYSGAESPRNSLHPDQGRWNH